MTDLGKSPGAAAPAKPGEFLDLKIGDRVGWGQDGQKSMVVTGVGMIGKIRRNKRRVRVVIDMEETGP